MQTAWRVQFAHAPRKGLFIKEASFKSAPNESWMRILGETRVADIFVPYHSGAPRFLDMTEVLSSLEGASSQDAGPCGRIIDDTVIQQVRTRGILWKHDAAVRHGHELVLWATLDAYNYSYIMSYAFRDDGTVALRLGATGMNYPGSPYEGHMHSALWRIDIDLNGQDNDSVYEVSHNESLGSALARDVTVPFNGGVEGSLDWEAVKFTELRVRDPHKNDRGHEIGYDLGAALLRRVLFAHFTGVFDHGCALSGAFSGGRLQAGGPPDGPPAFFGCPTPPGPRPPGA